MAGEGGGNIDSVLLEIYSVNDISMNVDRYVHICSRWWIPRMYIVKICMKMPNGNDHPMVEDRW